MNLNETPKMTVLPDIDPAELDAKTREKFEEACSQVEQTESVKTATDHHETVAAKLAKLKTAHVELNKRGKETFDRARSSQGNLEAGLVEQYTGGKEVNLSDLVRDVLFAEAEQRAITRAIAQIVEHEIPVTFANSLRTKEVVLLAKSRELGRIAHERFEKAMELMREAVDFEGGIAVDTRSMLSGLLAARATDLKGQAVALANEAHESERRYQEQVSRFASKAVIR